MTINQIVVISSTSFSIGLFYIGSKLINQKRSALFLFVYFSFKNKKIFYPWVTRNRIPQRNVSAHQYYSQFELKAFLTQGWVQHILFTEVFSIKYLSLQTCFFTFYFNFYCIEVCTLRFIYLFFWLFIDFSRQHNRWSTTLKVELIIWI